MSDRDVDILLRLKVGDTAAFAELVDSFERRLIGFFYSMCGQRELAEDCAQEVFLRIYRAREHYSPDASAATFVFRIARNYWIDVYRGRKSRPQELSLDPLGAEESDSKIASPLADLSSDDRSPQEVAIQGEDERKLKLALSKLSEGQQTVLELAVRQGLRYEEISKIMGIPVGTVKSRVHAAVQHLRDRMGVPEAKTE